MEKIKKALKIILIAILFVPVMVFFPACKDKGGKEPTTNNDTYIIHFYTGTDESFNIPNQTVMHGDLIRKPETPTKAGYMFVGWYTDVNFTYAWTFEVDIVKSDMTLYAKWEERHYG